MLLKVDIHPKSADPRQENDHIMLDMQISDVSGNNIKERHQEL